MGKKRGGLAGIWDRNKNIIKPIATVGAGLLGGPAAAAALNGAMSGLDREGKSGIGFDVGKGAMGAATGAAMGSAAGGLKNMVMSKLGAGAMPALGGTAPGNLIGVTGATGSAAIPGAAGMAAPSVTGGIGHSIMGALKDPKALAAIGQTAVGGLNAMQNAQAMRVQQAQQERQNALEEEDRKRKAAMDPVRAQLMAAIFGRLGVSPMQGGA